LTPFAGRVLIAAAVVVATLPVWWRFDIGVSFELSRNDCG
jgi:hypothetical protein